MKVKRMKYVLTIVLVIALAISLAACGNNNQPTPPPPPANDENGDNRDAADLGDIVIGINYEQSGPVASFGIQSVHGVQMAVDEVNAAGGIFGRQVRYILMDNNSDPMEAYQIATRMMIRDNVVGIIGPATSGNFGATIPAAMAHRVPMVTGSATRDNLIYDGAGNLSYFAFRICFRDAYQGTAMATFAFNNKGARRAALIIMVDTDYSVGLAASFRETFTAMGGEIVIEEGYVTDDQHFSPILTRMNATDFDVIFVPGYYNEVSQIIRQAREMGITVPILGGDGFDSPRLLEIAGPEALNNVFFSTHYSSLDEDPIVLDFIDRWRARHGEDPSSFNASGYDAAMFLFDAIRRAGIDDPELVRDAMAATVGFQGVTGTITIDAYHNAVKPVVVVEIADGVQVSSIRVPL